MKLFKYLSLFIFFIMSLNLLANVDIYSRLKSEQEWHIRPAVISPSGSVVELKVDVAQGEQVRWYQIIPDTSQYYKNANHPWEKNPYQWAGFGKVQYQKKHLKQFDNSLHITVDSAWLKYNNVFNSNYYHADVGSFWFEVEVIGVEGRKRVSTGLRDNDHRGLSKQVLRVSFTNGDGYLGTLSSFFNVPAIFGSVPYQSQHYLGVDCADVLMAANAIRNHGKVYDRNVAWLVTNLKHKAKLSDFNGVGSTIKWGTDISPGDFIAVRYRRNGQFAHIGALYKDSNNNGLLDGEDLVMHAGPNALSYSTVSDAGFLGEIVILDNQS
ncbi:hypothetical protein S4054249_13550 [Pseudoalteromonas luteoviolacea]|uniref:NlpC/P60 domain-containing protein n=2 Tax=Pseudoalteromonas luteoviolacea TaxID=43657 RepID=A0A0F6ADZ9_9GAMM|nr:hypothetical protein S4054249_13550 [Pseudoalteromonas luteoviolacea]AOT13728.1 hypothetical protein S40542_13520 [Pseudoalteromonas luteoviolacea]AOT18642.1 hypothetical protein S4054_13525 [Pseudoalteromonas luteoviolacea]KKE83624.1 hypothetical protein N479_13265 [Pseudoalteromonas luteoviolacea S4054]KZN72813.1 hypothetical protein N481_14400 [Pseudoalteromonas luteoviolacea S4047-1]